MSCSCELLQDEVAAAEPEIDQRTTQLVSNHRWNVPGYKVCPISAIYSTTEAACLHHLRRALLTIVHRRDLATSLFSKLCMSIDIRCDLGRTMHVLYSLH